jgi:hypothetical protein
MNTIIIQGGLGNQLFQIFTLLSYSFTYNLPFFFENKPTLRKDRPYYWDSFLSSLKPFIKSLHNHNLPIYKEEHFHYNKLIPPHRPFKLFGYFQSHKYFEDNKEEIFKLLKLKEQREHSKQKIYHIYHFDDTISLHFRIGDYKYLQQHHPVMNVSYYINALRHIIEKTERNDWNILYFYEEEDYHVVKEFIIVLQDKFNKITFTQINTKIVDSEQMLIMSLCQHNIIANSTFSWWGAFFNHNLEKIVTYPSRWFGPANISHKMDDMFPDVWIKIQV